MLKELFKFLKLLIGNANAIDNIETPRDIEALNYNGTLVVTNSTESPLEISCSFSKWCLKVNLLEQTIII